MADAEVKEPVITDEYIEIGENTKARLRELRHTFNLLTDAEAFKKNEAEYARKGIFPLYVGKENHQKLRGLRLGEAEKAKTGSVCFQAMVHTNEPAGLAGLQEVFDKWNGNGKHKGNALYKRRKEMAGDIYLMFAGEVAQAQNFFNKMLNETTKGISVEEYTNFRLTTDGVTNRNRLPEKDPVEIAAEKKPPEIAKQSQVDLWEDYQWLQKHVYSRCKIAEEAINKPVDPVNPPNPGFILGLHTFSQPGHLTMMPYSFPFDNKEQGKFGPDIVREIAIYVKRLCAMIGTEDVIIENHHTAGENYLEGASNLNLTDNGKPIVPVGSVIRGTFECGQHLAPEATEVARKSVINALSYKWPHLVKPIKLPSTHSMSFFSNTRTWFTPGSPRAEENPVAIPGLMPGHEPDEEYGNVHLVNCTVEELNNFKKQIIPKRFQGIDKEILKQVATSKNNQLANGSAIEKDDFFAYVDIKKDGNIIGQKPLYAPHDGTVFMAPRDPDVPAAQAEYVLMVPQYHNELEVDLRNHPLVHKADEILQRPNASFVRR